MKAVIANLFHEGIKENVLHRDFLITGDKISSLVLYLPVYDGPSVVIRLRPFVHLLHFFHLP